MPDYDEYTIKADNEEKAKSKAMERFKEDFRRHLDEYDYIDITVI